MVLGSSLVETVFFPNVGEQGLRAASREEKLKRKRPARLSKRRAGLFYVGPAEALRCAQGCSVR